MSWEDKQGTNEDNLLFSPQTRFKRWSEWLSSGSWIFWYQYITKSMNASQGEGKWIFTARSDIKCLTSYITLLLQNSSEYLHPIQAHDLPMAVPNKQGWLLFEPHYKALLRDSSTSISKLEKFNKVFIHTTSLRQVTLKHKNSSTTTVRHPILKNVNHTLPTCPRSIKRPGISHLRRRLRPRIATAHSRFLTPISLHLRPTNPRLSSLGTSLVDFLHPYSRSHHATLSLSHRCIPQIRGVQRSVSRVLLGGG